MKHKLENFEKETSFTYNQQDKLVSCFTMDPVLIRKLAPLCAENDDIQFVERQDDGTCWFRFPKRWLKVQPPRRLTDEQKEIYHQSGIALAEMMKKTKQLNTD